MHEGALLLVINSWLGCCVSGFKGKKKDADVSNNVTNYNSSAVHAGLGLRVDLKPQTTPY
jgi:hypothetical protein